MERQEDVKHCYGMNMIIIVINSFLTAHHYVNYFNRFRYW